MTILYGYYEANKYFKVNFIHFLYKHVIITKH